MHLVIVLIIVFCSCDDYFHDSGLAHGKHDCTAWEYFHTSGVDWDSTILLIERAGLVDLFDGKDVEYPEITFFGVTNLSILQFLLKTVGTDGNPIYGQIEDIPVDLCREMLLSHVIGKRMMKEEFGFENRGTLTGGTVVKTLTGIELRVYRTRSDFKDIPDIGAEGLAIHALQSGQMATVASADIETINAVIHSLDYDYLFSQL